MLVNKYRVPKRTWQSWNTWAQKTFSDLYSLMMNNPDLFTHPKMPAAKPVHWKTIAWNAAWIAADACNDSIPEEIFNTDGTKSKFRRKAA